MERGTRDLEANFFRLFPPKREAEGLLGLEAGGDGEGRVGSLLLSASCRGSAAGPECKPWAGRPGVRLGAEPRRRTGLVPRMALSLLRMGGHPGG